MKISKVFLYLVLSICICWSLLIFSGSTIIKKVAAYRFGTDVILHQVNVSPDLSVSIGRIEFNFPNARSESIVSGHLQALKIEWEIKNFDRFVTLSFGPSAIKNTGSLDRLVLELTWPGLFNFVSAESDLWMEKLDVFNEVAIDSINAEGFLDVNNFRLSDVLFNADHVMLKKNVNMFSELIFGHIDNIELGNSLPQIFDAAYLNVDKVEILDLSMSAEGFGGSFELNNGHLKSQVEFSEANFMGEALTSTGLRSELIWDFAEGNILGPIMFSSKNLLVRDFSIEVSDLGGKIIKSPNNLTLFLTGAVSDFELSNDSQFIGDLGNVVFDASASVDSIVTLDGNAATAKIDLFAPNSIEASAEFVANLENASGFLPCISMSCVINNLKVGYTLSINDMTVDGNLLCNSLPCASPSFEHQVKTNNTIRFFEEVNALGSFNPIVVAFLFTSFLQGEKQGDGHLIKLQ